METHIDETHFYTPMVKEVVISRLQDTLTQTQQELANYKKEVVPLQVHQELLKKLKKLTTTEDETFSNFRSEQEKLKKAQAQLEEATKKTNTIFSIYLDVLFVDHLLLIILCSY